MRVIVVGGGLSGLTLAAFLRRLNVDCVVLERAPFLQANFAAPYTLYANALSCFKAFDMSHIFENGGVEPEDTFGIMDAQRRWMLKLRNRQVRLAAFGEEDKIPLSTAPPANSDSIVSRRLAEERKLQMGNVPLRTTVSSKYLREALRRHTVEIKFSCEVVDLIPHSGIKGGVHAVLADGSTEWGDVVVGTDGLNSTVRKLLYPAEYVGTSSSTLGMTRIDGCAFVTRNMKGLEDPVELWGTRKSLSVTPLFKHGENRIDFTAMLYEAPRDLVAIESVPDDAEALRMLHGLLRKEFNTFGDDVATMLGEADLAFTTEVLEVPVMPRWYNKRAVLVGDAAHGCLPCFLGQDASLCVEDAALLATALLDVPLMSDSGFEYAFRQYETVRRDRVERYVRQTRRARAFTCTTHTALRDSALKVLPSPLFLAWQKWLSTWTYSAQMLEVDPKIKLETAFR